MGADGAVTGPFVLVLAMDFETAGHLQQFVQLIEPLVQYCREHEPHTL